MAKKKLQTLKVESVNEGVNAAQVANTEKGSVQNPYTIAELETMLEAGTWQGGYVESVGSVAGDDMSMYNEELNTLYEYARNNPSIGPCVRVTTSRTGYGTSSTLSVFLATAYDEQGNIIKQTTGYFLEPVVDGDHNTTEGSDTAIPAGDYDIVPSTFNGHPGYYEVTGVEGRTRILIHPGNTGIDTTGCLMPGTSYNYNEEDDEYSVSDSTNKFKELRSMFRQFGNNNIKIYVRPV